MNDVLVWLSVWAVGMLAIVGYRWRPKRRNRRVGLPDPRPDPRSSIEQFKRIHTQ